MSWYMMLQKNCCSSIYTLYKRNTDDGKTHKDSQTHVICQYVSYTCI